MGNLSDIKRKPLKWNTREKSKKRKEKRNLKKMEIMQRAEENFKIKSSEIKKDYNYETTGCYKIGSVQRITAFGNYKYGSQN